MVATHDPMLRGAWGQTQSGGVGAWLNVERRQRRAVGGTGPDVEQGGGAAQLDAERQQCWVLGGGSVCHVQAPSPPTPGRWYGVVGGSALPLPACHPSFLMGNLLVRYINILSHIS